MIKNLLYLGVLFVLLGCSRNTHKITDFDSSNYKTIKFEFVKNRTVNYNIIDSVWYSKLENTKNSLVGSINKITVVNNRLYIFDRLSNSVFIFDLTGKYLNKISKPGKGPGEHATIRDFYIDRVSNQLILLDSRQILIFYDSDCNYIKQIKPGFAFRSFAKYKGKFLFAQGGIPNQKQFNYNLIVCDSNMHIKQKIFPYDNITDGHSYNFFINGNSLNYIKDIKNSIFSFTNDTLKEVYRINFGSATLPENYFKDKAVSVSRENPEFPFLLNTFLENGDFIYFMFSYNRYIYSSIYSKSTSNMEYGFRYSKDNPFVAIPSQLELYDNVFVSCFDAENFLKLYAQLPNNHQYVKNKYYLKELTDFTRGMTNLDNPIVVFTKYKRF